MTTLTPNSSGTHRLLQQAARQDPHAVGQLFARHKERLRQMVRLRLDQQLRARFDSTAVLDEVYRDACARINEYLAQPSQSFFLWLRALTGQRIQAMHRQYVPDRAWHGGQELSLYRGALPEASAAALAGQLLGQKAAGPSATQAGRRLTVQDALNSMEALDREILALCHFEKLSNDEAASVLGIDRATASQAYVRALKRLKEVLSSIPGLLQRPGG